MKEVSIKASLSKKFIVFLVLACSQISSAVCPSFLAGEQVGTIEHSLLKEVSGIAASRHHPGVFWAHNDSGGLARVWALNQRGQHLGTYNLSGVTARDWEDIAIGPGPEFGEDYLYVADTGDNNGEIDFTYSIFRIPEPNISAAQAPVDVDVNGVEELLVRYPDSVRHDCETLLIDPLNGDIYLCSRDRWGDDAGMMRVYRYPAPQIPDVEFTLEHVNDVQLIDGEMAVGGEISVNGSEIAIRTKGTDERVLLWQRPAGTDLWEAFSNPMCVEPQMSEPQGEAVCFDSKGCGYYTTSEGVNQPIYYFARDGACPQATIKGDINWDGEVDFIDLALLNYHWRWNSFTERDFIILESFEDYNDSSELELQWYDYGSTPVQSLEVTEVYSGSKAMKVEYSGENEITIRKDLGTAEDWRDYDKVNIWFKGMGSNRAKDIVLSIVNTSGAVADSATFVNGTKERNWTALEIDLDPNNILLADVRYVDLVVKAEGKSGTVYFDNLEVTTVGPIYICDLPVAEDLNFDCFVNIFDFTIMALHWCESAN